MTRLHNWSRRRLVASALVAVGVVALTGTALAGHLTSGVKSYTGCLVPKDGVIIKVKEGDAPAGPCTGGMQQVHLSGGDITKITVTGGLTGGGDNGEVTIGLDANHSLPQGCDSFQFPMKSSSGWTCADHESGTGISRSRSITSGGASSVTYGIASRYRVQNDPDCASGQFATGFADDGTIQCGTPATGGVHAYSATVGPTTLAGDTLVISKTLPAGTYLLFATVALENQDGNSGSDEVSEAECRIPGYTTGTQGLKWDSDFDTADTKESVALSSAINHGGGAVELRCTEGSADVDVYQATLTAIKVDSLG